MLAFLICAAWASTATAATIPVSPGSGNPIQVAIDAANPGDTINVAAGTYTINGLVVGKSLTLRGANAGKTGTDPTRVAESKIIGTPSASIYLVQLLAKDVVFDGFEVTNPSYDAGALVQDASLILAGQSGFGSTDSGIQVLNNRVHDLATGWTMPDGCSINGINVGPCDSPSIRGNYVYNLSASGVANESVGIITWGNSAVDTVNNAKIEDNVVRNITCNLGGLARGINVGYGSASASVSNNEVSGSQIGILMTGAPVPGSVLVKGNTIYGMTAEGILVRSGSPNPVTIEDNRVTAPVGVRVGAGATSVTLLNNSLAGSPVGVDSAASALISAINNWWGQASGPAIGQVVGSVTASPYITAYIDDPAKTGALGFWPLAAYTITFNSDGSAVAPQTVGYGLLATAPAAPTKTGYSFLGWYTNPWPSMITEYTRTNFDGSWERSLTPFAIGAAKQSISGSSITLSIDAGSGYADSGVVFWHGKLSDLPAFTLNEAGSGSDYGVNLWFDIDGDGTFFNPGSTDGYAVSSSPMFNGTTTVNDLTKFDMYTGSPAPQGITLAALKTGGAPGITGNTYVTVYVGVVSMTGSNSPKQAVVTPATQFQWDFTLQPVVSATTLDAVWAANSYTLTFTSNGGSIVTPSTAPFGSVVSAPTAPIKTGFAFAGWYSDSLLTTPYTFTTMPAGNTTAYAKWTALMPVYRFYNFRNNSHFYTASATERDNVFWTLFSTYRYEGIAYHVNAASSDNGDPLYRFYNFKKGVHFYTSSEAEKNKVLATLSSTYRLEGVAYYVSHNPSGAPVYRFYNFKQGVHFYTASAAERDNVIATLSWTYRFEGVGFCLAP